VPRLNDAILEFQLRARGKTFMAPETKTGSCHGNRPGINHCRFWQRRIRITRTRRAPNVAFQWEPIRLPIRSIALFIASHVTLDSNFMDVIYFSACHCCYRAKF